MPYEIVIEPDAGEHVDAFPIAERRRISDAIAEQLAQTPTVETRNRKKLRPNTLAEWELRVGEFRVFYKVAESDSRVRVIAVGHKEHERLFIGGKEYQL